MIWNNVNVYGIWRQVSSISQHNAKQVIILDELYRCVKGPDTKIMKLQNNMGWVLEIFRVALFTAFFVDW